MAGGVEELEVLLVAQRLAFLTSSFAIDSPEKLRQGVAAFCEALKPQVPFVARPLFSEAGMRKPDSNNHSPSSDAYAEARESISATPTVCSCDDRIDAPHLAKQIDLVGSEVREGIDHIRELVRSVADLKTGMRNLHSAVLELKPVASRRGPSPSPTPNKNSDETSRSLIPAHEAPVNASSNRKSGGSSISPDLSPAARAQPSSAAPPSGSIPSFTTSNSSPVLPRLPLRRVNPSLLGDQTPIVAPRSQHTSVTELAGSAPVNTSKTILKNPAYDPTSSPVLANAIEATESHLKPPLIATAVDSYYTCNEGEIDIKKGDKITILDFPDTPTGWMYGEIITKRRGIFPANYIEKLPPPKVEKNRRGTETSGMAGPRPESPVIATSRYRFTTSKPGELSLSPGDKITILDSPGTPLGWMSGETVETRRGLFPARYVKLDEGPSPNKRT